MAQDKLKSFWIGTDRYTREVVSYKTEDDALAMSLHYHLIEDYSSWKAKDQYRELYQQIEGYETERE